MRHFTQRLVAVASLAIAGCQPGTRPAPPAPPAPTPQADVSYRSITDVDTPRYELDDAQTAGLPEQGRDNAAPVYPPQLVALRLPPVEVRATLVVDTQGRVSDVRISPPPTDDASRRAFDEAVRVAALRWTFTPLRIYRWVEDADGGTHRDAGAARPFSQDYLFRFELRDGMPVVSAGVPPAAASAAR